MHQRSGRFHSAAMNDEGGGNVSIKQLLTFVRAAQHAIEKDYGHSDAAIKFEILGDFIEHDVANGAPFVFSTRTLGM